MLVMAVTLKSLLVLLFPNCRTLFVLIEIGLSEAPFTTLVSPPDSISLFRFSECQAPSIAKFPVCGTSRRPPYFLSILPKAFFPQPVLTSFPLFRLRWTHTDLFPYVFLAVSSYLSLSSLFFFFFAGNPRRFF